MATTDSSKCACSRPEECGHFKALVTLQAEHSHIGETIRRSGLSLYMQELNK